MHDESGVLQLDSGDGRNAGREIFEDLAPLGGVPFCNSKMFDAEGSL